MKIVWRFIAFGFGAYILTLICSDRDGSGGMILLLAILMIGIYICKAGKNNSKIHSQNKENQPFGWFFIVKKTGKWLIVVITM